MRKEVKRRRGYTRVSSKNQATLPVDVLREARLKAGDELRVTADGDGRVLLSREADLIERHAGALAGVYGARYLDELRAEWL